MNRIGSVIILLLSSCPAFAQQTVEAPDEQAAQFSPEPGYECDREAQRCGKNGQPNFHMTRIQFGDKAGLALLQEAPQVVDLSGTVFYPEVGISCEISVQICYQDLQASRSHTERYFSKVAAARLDDFIALREKSAAEPTFKPKQGTACVRQSGICYDQRGPSIGLTRFFFGHAAAIRLLSGLLKHQAKRTNDKSN